ncbi:MAG TPA: FAD-binding oxidoreductase, partial [Acidimicrobiaceae bacterium]|nr:FAD-binding oxidoreductase [Acidimicrobiaceae bacterium]
MLSLMVVFCMARSPIGQTGTVHSLLKNVRALLGDSAVLDELTAAHGADSGSLRVEPTDTQGVSAVLRACAEAEVAVVPEGGGSGLVGGAGPQPFPHVLLSTRRLQTLEHRSGEPAARVGAGVTLAELERSLAPTAWRYGIDFGARDQATLGGTITTNAGGSGVFRFGTTRQQVLGLEYVLADGTVVSDLSPLMKDNTGLSLQDLIIGSEGILAIVTQASIRLWPRPEHRATVLAGFPDLDAALQASRVAARSVPIEAIEFMDGACLSAVAQHTSVAHPLEGHGAALLLESAHDDQTVALAALHDWIDATSPSATAAATDRADRARLWAFREGIVPAITARSSFPLLKFDLTLPQESLAGFLDWCTTQFGDAAWQFGHAADGNVHLNLTDVAQGERGAISDTVYRQVCALSGSVSAEHGIGRYKVAALAQQRTSAELSLMRGIKQVFDPKGILNPG